MTEQEKQAWYETVLARANQAGAYAAIGGMQVVAVGFIIGVLQDSAETALNSSSDVLFTAAACLRAKRLEEEAAKKYGAD